MTDSYQRFVNVVNGVMLQTRIDAANFQSPHAVAIHMQDYNRIEALASIG